MKKEPCSECDLPAWCRGFCRLHYGRWHRASHPEWVERKNAARKKRWAERSWDDKRDERLRLLYGISIDDYRAILRKQRDRCANSACGRSDPGGRHGEWHVDHDHLSGETRGLLCNGCNIALGHLRDDAEIIAGLAAYMRAHRQLRLAV